MKWAEKCVIMFFLGWCVGMVTLILGLIAIAMEGSP